MHNLGSNRSWLIIIIASNSTIFNVKKLNLCVLKELLKSKLLSMKEKRKHPSPSRKAGVTRRSIQDKLHWGRALRSHSFWRMSPALWNRQRKQILHILPRAPQFWRTVLTMSGDKTKDTYVMVWRKKSTACLQLNVNSKNMQITWVRNVCHVLVLLM